MDLEKLNEPREVRNAIPREERRPIGKQEGSTGRQAGSILGSRQEAHWEAGRKQWEAGKST